MGGIGGIFMQRMLVGTSEGIPDQGLYSKPLKFLTARLAATGLAGTRTGILYIYNSIRLCYTVILTPPESMMCQYVTTLYVITYCVPHATTETEKCYLSLQLTRLEGLRVSLVL